MRYKFFFAFLGLGFVLAGLGYLAFKYVQYHPTLRIGVSAYTGGEYFTLARKAEYFERCGIHVKVVEFGSLEDVQQAFEWKQIDGMVCTLVDAMVTRQKNNIQDPKIVLIPSYPQKTHSCQLFVNSDIKQLRDLKGKRIGAEVNSYGGYVLNKILKAEGLTHKDISILPMDPTAATAFLNHERIDGVVTYPPFTKTLPEDVTPIFSTAQWPKEMQLNVLLMHKASIKEFRNRLMLFIKKWDEFLDFCRDNPDKCCYLLKAHHRISNEAANFLMKSVYPLRIEEQIPLFCINRYVLDILSNINEEMIVNSDLRPFDRSYESIFDSSFIHGTLND